MLFFTATPQLSLRGHTFFCLARKKYAKKRRGTRNSADAQKNESLHFTCCRSFFCSPNALTGDRQLGFLSARYAVRIVTCAPVEYLTYGSRNRRRVFRLPRRTVVYASVSRFWWLEIYFRTNQTPGMIQEGGRNPLLGRFKGIPKGEIEIPLWRFLFTASGFFFAAQRKRG